MLKGKIFLFQGVPEGRAFHYNPAGQAGISIPIPNANLCFLFRHKQNEKKTMLLIPALPRCRRVPQEKP